ncbi:hypothetical protein DFS34DRAFT_596827 [Phlyctochytrium arcticum]|nr:hypothetical protein DFS34DRAFT_596827 [Phlyctochytrium arcticum]
MANGAMMDGSPRQIRSSSPSPSPPISVMSSEARVSTVGPDDVNQSQSINSAKPPSATIVVVASRGTSLPNAPPAPSDRSSPQKSYLSQRPSIVPMVPQRLFNADLESSNRAPVKHPEPAQCHPSQQTITEVIVVDDEETAPSPSRCRKRKRSDSVQRNLRSWFDATRNMQRELERIRQIYDKNRRRQEQEPARFGSITPRIKATNTQIHASSTWIDAYIARFGGKVLRNVADTPESRITSASISLLSPTASPVSCLTSTHKTSRSDTGAIPLPATTPPPPMPSSSSSSAAGAGTPGRKSRSKKKKSNPLLEPTRTEINRAIDAAFSLQPRTTKRKPTDAAAAVLSEVSERGAGGPPGGENIPTVTVAADLSEWPPQPPQQPQQRHQKLISDATTSFASWSLSSSSFPVPSTSICGLPPLTPPSFPAVLLPPRPASCPPTASNFSDTDDPPNPPPVPSTTKSPTKSTTKSPTKSTTKSTTKPQHPPKNVVRPKHQRDQGKKKPETMQDRTIPGIWNAASNLLQPGEGDGRFLGSLPMSSNYPPHMPTGSDYSSNMPVGSDYQGRIIGQPSYNHQPQQVPLQPGEPSSWTSQYAQWQQQTAYLLSASGSYPPRDNMQQWRQSSSTYTVPGPPYYQYSQPIPDLPPQCPSDQAPAPQQAPQPELSARARILPGPAELEPRPTLPHPHQPFSIDSGSQPISNQQLVLNPSACHSNYTFPASTSLPPSQAAQCPPRSQMTAFTPAPDESTRALQIRQVMQSTLTAYQRSVVLSNMDQQVPTGSRPPPGPRGSHLHPHRRFIPRPNVNQPGCWHQDSMAGRPAPHNHNLWVDAHNSNKPKDSRDGVPMELSPASTSDTSTLQNASCVRGFLQIAQHRRRQGFGDAVSELQHLNREEIHLKMLQAGLETRRKHLLWEVSSTQPMVTEPAEVAGTSLAAEETELPGDSLNTISLPGADVHTTTATAKRQDPASKCIQLPKKLPVSRSGASDGRSRRTSNKSGPRQIFWNPVKFLVGPTAIMSSNLGYRHHFDVPTHLFPMLTKPYGWNRVRMGLINAMGDPQSWPAAFLEYDLNGTLNSIPADKTYLLINFAMFPGTNSIAFKVDPQQVTAELTDGSLRLVVELVDLAVLERAAEYVEKQAPTTSLNASNDLHFRLLNAKIDFKDPTTNQRMTVPVRSKYCKHTRCFDLVTHLTRIDTFPCPATRNAPRNCPICKEDADAAFLRVDELVSQSLKKFGEEDEAILLHRENRERSQVWVVNGTKIFVSRLSDMEADMEADAAESGPANFESQIEESTLDADLVLVSEAAQSSEQPVHCNLEETHSANIETLIKAAEIVEKRAALPVKMNIGTSVPKRHLTLMRDVAQQTINASPVMVVEDVYLAKAAEGQPAREGTAEDDFSAKNASKQLLEEASESAAEHTEHISRMDDDLLPDPLPKTEVDDAKAIDLTAHAISHGTGVAQSIDEQPSGIPKGNQTIPKPTLDAPIDQSPHEDSHPEPFSSPSKLSLAPTADLLSNLEAQVSSSHDAQLARINSALRNMFQGAAFIDKFYQPSTVAPRSALSLVPSLMTLSIGALRRTSICERRANLEAAMELVREEKLVSPSLDRSLRQSPIEEDYDSEILDQGIVPQSAERQSPQKAHGWEKFDAELDDRFGPGITTREDQLRGDDDSESDMILAEGTSVARIPVAMNISIKATVASRASRLCRRSGGKILPPASFVQSEALQSESPSPLLVKRSVKRIVADSSDEDAVTGTLSRLNPKKKGTASAKSEQTLAERRKSNMLRIQTRTIKDADAVQTGKPPSSSTTFTRTQAKRARNKSPPRPSPVNLLSASPNRKVPAAASQRPMPTTPLSPSKRKNSITGRDSTQSFAASGAPRRKSSQSEDRLQSAGKKAMPQKKNQPLPSSTSPAAATPAATTAKCKARLASCSAPRAIKREDSPPPPPPGPPPNISFSAVPLPQDLLPQAALRKPIISTTASAHTTPDAKRRRYARRDPSPVVPDDALPRRISFVMSTPDKGKGHLKSQRFK